MVLYRILHKTCIYSNIYVYFMHNVYKTLKYAIFRQLPWFFAYCFNFQNNSNCSLVY